jgi:CheY-like chemotaxis protein
MTFAVCEGPFGAIPPSSDPLATGVSSTGRLKVPPAAADAHMWNKSETRAGPRRGRGESRDAMKSLEILVCDDEQSICLLLEDVLGRFGHHVTTCQEGLVALEHASRNTFDVVFLDIRMPGMDGVEVLKRVRAIHPGATFVMITGYAHTDLMEESLQSGASACLAKPFSLLQLKKIVEAVAAGEPVSV